MWLLQVDDGDPCLAVGGAGPQFEVRFALTGEVLPDRALVSKARTAIARHHARDVVASFPVLSAAAVSSLRPDRFAIGSAVNQTSRQIGGSLGIATLVLLTSQTTGLATAVSHFHHVWAFGAITSLGAGLIATLIPRRSAKAKAEVKALEPELVDADAGLPLASPEPDA